jgi:hypothetical protein
MPASSRGPGRIRMASQGRATGTTRPRWRQPGRGAPAGLPAPRRRSRAGTPPSTRRRGGWSSRGSTSPPGAGSPMHRDLYRAGGGASAPSDHPPRPWGLRSDVEGEEGGAPRFARGSCLGAFDPAQDPAPAARGTDRPRRADLSRGPRTRRGPARHSRLPAGPASRAGVVRSTLGEADSARNPSGRAWTTWCLPFVAAIPGPGSTAGCQPEGSRNVRARRCACGRAGWRGELSSLSPGASRIRHLALPGAKPHQARQNSGRAQRETGMPGGRRVEVTQEGGVAAHFPHVLRSISDRRLEGRLVHSHQS